MKKRLPFLAGIFASVLFGFSFLAARIALNINGNDPMSFLAFRFAIAFPTMALMLWFGLGKVDYRGKDIRILLLCGLLNPIISQFFELTATIYAPTSQIALIFSLVPVFVVIFSATINKESPTKLQLLFIGMSVAGVVVIQFVEGQVKGGTTLGFLLAVVACLFIAIQRIFIRRASARFSAFEIIFVTTGMGFVYFPIVSAIQHYLKGDISRYFESLSHPAFVLAIFYSSVVCCVAGFLLMTYAAANLPIAVSSAANTVVTVISVFAGVFFLNENFRVVDIIGTILILSAVLVMSFSYNPSESNKYRVEISEEGKTVFRTDKTADDQRK